MTDYIDRQAAIDALDQIFDRCEEIEAHLPEGDPDRTGYKMYPDYMTVWKYLHQLPYAQPEHPKGKWIKLDSYDRRDHFYACSECGRLINIICNAHLEDYPFCHCGADMRGEQDE